VPRENLLARSKVICEIDRAHLGQQRHDRWDEEGKGCPGELERFPTGALGAPGSHAGMLPATIMGEGELQATGYVRKIT